MRTCSFLFLLQALLAAALAAQEKAAPPGNPTIAFEPKGVAISGLTPRGRVVWLEVARELSDMSLRLVRNSGMVADEDGDGTVRVGMEDGVPEQSVWFAADLETGAFLTATRPALPRRAMDLPLSALRPAAVRGSDVVDLPRRQVEVLVIRPIAAAGTRGGAGAWIGTFGDGGPGDVDATGNGQLQVALDSLVGLGDTADRSAALLEPNDILVAVDSTSLDVYAGSLAVPR